jgi:predicted membrane channel-forming protein YqfA (hemolysin III family)
MEFYKRTLFAEFFIMAVLVGSLNQVATAYNLYWKIEQFDSLMHFLGGALCAIFTIWLYFYSDLFKPADRSLKRHFFISLLGVIFISVCWEIFELVTGTAVAHWNEYTFDTSLDYTMDFLGGVAACLYAYMKQVQAIVPLEAKRVEPPDNLPV